MLVRRAKQLRMRKRFLPLKRKQPKLKRVKPSPRLFLRPKLQEMPRRNLQNPQVRLMRK